MATVKTKSTLASEPVRLPDASISITKGTLSVSVQELNGTIDTKLGGVDTIHNYDDLEMLGKLVSLAHFSLTETQENEDCCCGCNECFSECE